MAARKRERVQTEFHDGGKCSSEVNASPLATARTASGALDPLGHCP